MTKKISKILLACSLLLTGVMMTPKDIYASDASTYGSAITVTNKKFTNVLSFGTSGNKGVITLDVNMKLYTDSLTTTMKYYSSTCTPGYSSTTTACSLEAVYVDENKNYTSSTDSSIMIIDFYIKTVVNSKSYYTVYRFNYQSNDIKSHYIFEGPSTTPISRD